MNAVEEGLNEITSSVIENIPSTTWENASLSICALNKMISIKSFYEDNGNFISFDPEDNGTDVTLKIKKLREEMYKTAPDKGAWFSAMVTIMKDGKYKSFFDYDSEPEFKYVPSTDKFVDDLKTFPRMEGLIPDWLKVKIGL